ncbi:MAG: type II toxin-antitoxin system HicA family toxin [Nitrospira sp.]|nr:type II toxin-antitoxin system HicA family toxin [Nitrospira sp.]
MSRWPSTSASRVLAALLRIGWTIKRTTGSHRVLARTGMDRLVWGLEQVPVDVECSVKDADDIDRF